MSGYSDRTYVFYCDSCRRRSLYHTHSAGRESEQHEEGIKVSVLCPCGDLVDFSCLKEIDCDA